MQTCSEIVAASETCDERVRSGPSLFSDDWRCLCSSLVFFNNFLYSLRAIFFRFSTNAWPTAKHTCKTLIGKHMLRVKDLSSRKFQVSSSALTWKGKHSPLSLFPIFSIFPGFLQRDFVFPLDFVVCFLWSRLLSSSAILNLQNTAYLIAYYCGRLFF